MTRPVTRPARRPERPGPAARPRVLGRDLADHRAAAPGDRRRGPAAGRDRRGAGVGQLPLVRGVRRPEGTRRRPVGAAPGPLAEHLGGRRPAGRLLLRGGAGGQARVRRRRPARPPAGRDPGGGGGRGDGRAGAAVRAGQPRHRRRCAARVGDPHRHRHRLRGRRPGRAEHPPAVGAAHLPADPGRGRRPARDHRDRDLLHPFARARLAGARRRAHRRVRRAGAAAGPDLVAPGAARPGRVGSRARLGGARHRGGRAAGADRPRRPQRGQRGPRRRPRHGRALRAPAAAAVLRPRRAGVRPLRRRGHRRRLVRPDERPGGPGRPRHRARPGRGQDRGHPRGRRS